MLVRPKVFSRKKKRRVGSLKKYKGIGEKNKRPLFVGEREMLAWIYLYTWKKNVKKLF